MRPADADSGEAFAQPMRSAEVDRREAFRELLAALGQEFERLDSEKGALAEELQQLRAEPWCSVPARGPAAGGRLQLPCPQQPSFAHVEQPSFVPVEDTCEYARDEPTVGEPPVASLASEAEAEGSAEFAHEVTMHASQTWAEHQREFTTKTKSYLEAEDFYENLYDLTRAFHALCPGKRDTIRDKDLVEMSACQHGVDLQHESLADSRPRFGAAIKALNKELGIRAGRRQRATAADIRLDTFIAIVQRKEVHNHAFYVNASDDILDAISEIRDILVREDTLRKVAKATNMSYGDIYQAKKPPTAPSRMDVVLLYIDPVIGFVILLNAISIGLSTDIEAESKFWMWCELSFTIVFVMELLIKLGAFGIRTFFFGPEKIWNLFDTFVVAIAIVDVVFGLMGEMVNLRNFTIIRLLRFARLTKLVRVLKLKVFKELALLVNGILAGLRTLIWAMVFLIFVLFALGVLLTQTVGKTLEADWTDMCIDVQEADHQRACNNSVDHILKHRKELFGDVPRSMFTVFRCFTEGCSSVDGTPLTPYFYNIHGLTVIVAYFIVTLFVIFGLFNLIMAVFVENTIENAKHDDARRREARAGEHLRVAKKLQEVIIMFCTAQQKQTKEDGVGMVTRTDGRKGNSSGSWFQKTFSIGAATAAANLKDLGLQQQHETDSAAMKNLSMKVTHDAFLCMLENAELQEMLDDLDIGVSSRRNLFEVLDANCNGTLEVNELVQGLLKLRGTAEKADVIASLLAIRSMQNSLKAMEVLSLHQQELIEDIAEAQRRAEDTLDVLSRGRPGVLPMSDSPSLREQRAADLERRASTPTAVPGLSIMRADAQRRAKLPPSKI